MKKSKKRGFFRHWWHQLVGIPLHWFCRSAPSMTADEDERVYRLEYWAESTKANFKILRLQWGQLLDWRYSGLELDKRRGSRMFWSMHHPMSGTRQLAEWHRRGPHNPPPAVKGIMIAARQVMNDHQHRVRAGKIMDGKE